jgi:hypothetical protein
MVKVTLTLYVKRLPINNSTTHEPLTLKPHKCIAFCHKMTSFDFWAQAVRGQDHNHLIGNTVSDQYLNNL